jgi:hypothetical protein
MKVKPGVSDQVVRRDDPAARTGAPAPMPSERAIKLLGSGEWALLIEALAMGDARAVRTRRRANRVMQSRGERQRVAGTGLSAGDRKV